MARVPSNVSGVSSASGPTNDARRAAEEDRPDRARPSGRRRRRGRAARAGSSRTAPRRRPVGRRGRDRQKSFGPGRALRADRRRTPRRHRAGSAGTLTSVSTLLTAVGLPKRPTSTGNGGLLRGSPRPPSIDSKSAVSSPQMYAPAPRRSSMSKAKPEPSDVVARAAPAGEPPRSRGPSARRRAGTRRAGRGSRALAPVANASIVMPSMSANGSSSMSTRSLNVPGSDSSALHTR